MPQGKGTYGSKLGRPPKKKKALGGKVGDGVDYYPRPKFDETKPVKFEHNKKGGKMNGPSHDNGGIDINVEGGEIVINKNINNAAGKHEENLLNLNNNPDDYKIVRDNDNSYKWPSNDARKRGE